jgi:hypothetical protein
MYSLKEIENALEKDKLSDALYKLERFARAKDLSELSEWCSYELNGYPKGDYQKEEVILKYRTLSVQWRDIYGRTILVDPQLSILQKVPFWLGVTELEPFLKKGCAYSVPSLIEMVNRYSTVPVQTAWVSSDIIEGLFSKIRLQARSRLHDAGLDLSADSGIDNFVSNYSVGKISVALFILIAALASLYYVSNKFSTNATIAIGFFLAIVILFILSRNKKISDALAELDKIGSILAILFSIVTIVWLVDKSEKQETTSTATPSATPLITIINPEKSIPEQRKNERIIPPGFKQPSPTTPNHLISSETYEIAFQIIDGTHEGATIETGPVMGASVTIKNRQTGEEFRATSDSWGKFKKVLPVGSYLIKAFRRDFNDADNTCSVSKESSSIPCKVIFTYRKDAVAQVGQILGSVADEQGNPLANVRITCKSKVLSAQPAPEDYSDNSGSFSITEIPHGEYSVIFKLDGYKDVVKLCDTQKSSQCYMYVKLPKK